MTLEQEQTDGRYWEPPTEYSLKQGDLFYNVPTLVLPPHPTFVLRTNGSNVAELADFELFPENTPSLEIVAEARFDTLSMLMTPTCHVSEGEKDEDIAVIVPVMPIRLLLDEPKTIERILQGQAYGEHLHLFGLPRTTLGHGVLSMDSVAILDRPTSLLKHELRDYRRLGLHLDVRVELRKKLARFWARASAEKQIDDAIQKQLQAGRPFEDFD
jgi:hypothetical protein